MFVRPVEPKPPSKPKPRPVALQPRKSKKTTKQQKPQQLPPPPPPPPQASTAKERKKSRLSNAVPNALGNVSTPESHQKLPFLRIMVKRDPVIEEMKPVRDMEEIEPVQDIKEIKPVEANEDMGSVQAEKLEKSFDSGSTESANLSNEKVFKTEVKCERDSTDSVCPSISPSFFESEAKREPDFAWMTDQGYSEIADQGYSGMAEQSFVKTELKSERGSSFEDEIFNRTFVKTEIKGEGGTFE